MPGTSRTFTCSILTTTLQSVTPSRPHFTNEKTEVQRGYVTCPVSHSREEVSQGLFLDLTEWLFPGLTRGGGIKYRPQTQAPGPVGGHLLSRGAGKLRSAVGGALLHYRG